MSQYEFLEFSEADGVARINLNRPAQANALDLPLAKELVAATAACKASSTVRAVILTGNGKLFCAGGDLGSMANAEGPVDKHLKELADTCHVAYINILTMRAPVVMAVNGAAAGIGFGLSMVGDITLASDKSSFLLAYTAAGLSPDGGTSKILPLVVGLKRAKELALLNRKLSAEEALEWGIVNQVVAADELMAAAEKMASRLATGPTNAFGSVKKLMLDALTQSLGDTMDAESVTIAANAVSPDGTEGIDAFMNKRKPEYKG